LAAPPPPYEPPEEIGRLSRSVPKGLGALFSTPTYVSALDVAGGAPSPLRLSAREVFAASSWSPECEATSRAYRKRETVAKVALSTLMLTGGGLAIGFTASDVTSGWDPNTRLLVGLLGGTVGLGVGLLGVTMPIRPNDTVLSCVGHAPRASLP
jgi:hypothetical protein